MVMVDLFHVVFVDSNYSIYLLDNSITPVVVTGANNDPNYTIDKQFTESIAYGKDKFVAVGYIHLIKILYKNI